MIIAMSSEITRLDGEKETYEVQSESDISKFYIVKFMDGTSIYCTCKDFEMQSEK